MGGKKLILQFALSLFLIGGLIGCGEEVTIKPSGKLRLDYPAADYQTLDVGCPYTFEHNTSSQVAVKPTCDINLTYSRMKATLYLTYQRVTNSNLNDLLRDAQKLTYDHTVKANEIFEQPRVDSINKVYGMFYMINGDAATQTQFYVTDSLNHFVSGSVYFESKPNFDSIYPGVVYMRDDVRRLMETIAWKNFD